MKVEKAPEIDQVNSFANATLQHTEDGMTAYSVSFTIQARDREHLEGRIIPAIATIERLLDELISPTEIGLAHGPSDVAFDFYEKIETTHIAGDAQRSKLANDSRDWMKCEAMDCRWSSVIAIDDQMSDEDRATILRQRHSVHVRTLVREETGYETDDL